MKKDFKPSENIEIILNDIVKNINELKKLKKEYNNKLSMIDLEKSDLDHEIEFAQHDAINMIKLYNHLKEVLIKRRQIKNDASVVESLLSTISNKNYNDDKSCNFIKDSFEQKIKNSNNSTYTVKICNFLDFTNEKTLFKSRKNHNKNDNL